ncbi:MAG: VCBS repeat-containing protein [Sandaracinaceae bacterium]|nr:VCBS repeat-containing protein [Sandaracinaceae bacterium]
MSKRNIGALVAVIVVGLAGAGLWACGGGEETPTPSPTPNPTATQEGHAEGTPPPSGGSADVPDDLPNGLLLAYSQFPVRDGRVVPEPGAARLEILTRSGGEWHVEVVEDDTSNVFHKAMVYTPPGGEPGILTLGAQGARVKLWRRQNGRWTAQTLWEASFGGRFDRMRDAEAADLFGDGRAALAIATHDQGVVATLRANANGGFDATELVRTPNMFIHEIEIGDLNGDGTPEVYATPSEPNDLDGGDQSGSVVRFVPRNGNQQTVVADLGNRHAKEIWVGDVDGDGRDELYVAVEAHTTGTGANVEIDAPVEIRRYEANTPATGGVVIARIQDRLCRFLTVGDLDGDGHREMVAAAFSSGLWLLRPGRDPNGEWSMESIDRESSGFEHASYIADLDEDGRDELYVAADEQGEVRRYVWVNGRPRRSVIHRRDVPRSQMTWNITDAPVSLIGR